MHRVAIYWRYAYQSPNHRPRWSFVLTIQHVNKHEILFHNIYRRIPQASKNLRQEKIFRSHTYCGKLYVPDDRSQI